MSFHSRRVGLGPLAFNVSMAEDVASASVGFSLRNRAWRALYRRILRPRFLTGGIPTEDTLETDTNLVSDDPGAPLQERIGRISWYHSLDLGGVVTPGLFDHRPFLHHFGIPNRLDGLRVLDVATFDGFWAFEFERRGAAEVVALDVPCVAELDIPPRIRQRMSPALLASPVSQGFSLAHEVLKSRVQRARLNVYDVTPERLGMFDLVFCGDLQLHLMSPITALQRIRSVTRGRALIVDYIRPDLDRLDGCRTMHYHGGRGQCAWWLFSRAALEAMIRDAGFSRIDSAGTFRRGSGNEEARGTRAVFWAHP